MPPMPADVTTQPLTFHASDGTPLVGTLFTPAHCTQPPVLIAGALGVPQRFYAHFARWLAAQGHVVLSFDVRGIGASRRPEHRRSLRGLNADMLTWAQGDFTAAVHCLAAQSGCESVHVLGHSLGAHHAGMTLPSTQARIAKLLSVAAGAGSWRDWATPSRRRAPWMLHVAGPLLTPVFGYFPGKRLGMVGDLPGPVMRQWSRWCRHPGFAVGADPQLVVGALQAARFPITALSFTDDEAMTEGCTQRLLAFMPNAPSVLQRLRPDEVGLPAIGHLGAFRPSGEARLWPLMAALLRAS